MAEKTQLSAEIPKRRWVGVLLSLFVPGFGLVRAGHITRGVIWFIADYGIGIFGMLLVIWRSIPFWGVVAGALIAMFFHIAMLVDSFRPGKLSPRLWVLFVLLSITILCIPDGSRRIARAFKVPTSSMEPTLLGRSHGVEDRFIVDRLSYLFAPPKRGDLVAFRTKGMSGISGDDIYVKRLVGLPGEMIEMRDGHLFANGRMLTVSDGIPDFMYKNPPGHPPAIPLEVGYEVPKNSFFVIGDNAQNSADSRYWGAVPQANIYGRVARIYYPFSRAGIPH